jgi:ribosomal protein S18 acetylase RimI-like enzyme
MNQQWFILTRPLFGMRELLKPQRESVVFGAYTHGLIGILGLYRSNKRKAAHKANFLGMFVLPDCRRQGVAVRLLDAAIRYARTLDGVTSVHLSVSESALAAQHLYEKAGFQTWGVEPDAIRFGQSINNEHHMWLPLDGASDRPLLAEMLTVD